LLTHILDFSAKLTGGDENVFDFSLNVNSNENGSYSTSFFLAAGGEYQLHVYLRDTEIAQSPYPISIRETGTFICSNALVGTFAAIIGVTSAIYIVLMFLVYWFKHTKAIHSASPLFCYLIVREFEAIRHNLVLIILLADRSSYFEHYGWNLDR